MKSGEEHRDREEQPLENSRRDSQCRGRQGEDSQRQEDRHPEDRHPEDRRQEDRHQEDRYQEDQRQEHRHPEDQCQEHRHPGHEYRRGSGRLSHISLMVAILSVLFSVAVLCVAAYYVASHRQVQEADTKGLAAEANVKTGTLNDPAGEQERLDDIVREGMVSFSINATPSLKDGASEANLLVENPPENRTRFTVTIIREDTGEEIYRSGYLDPEQYIDNAPLDVKLPKGEYPCMAYFDSYRIEDSSYIGRAAAQITVYVLN